MFSCFAASTPSRPAAVQLGAADRRGGSRERRRDGELPHGLHQASGPLRAAGRAYIGYHRGVDDSYLITCPYCGETVEIYLEPDVSGRLVQDCEVCCNPWLLCISREEDERTVDVSRADGSE